MRAFSGTSSAPALPLAAATPPGTPAAPAPADDQPSSFADVLQQQDATGTGPAPAKSTATTATAAPNPPPAAAKSAATGTRSLGNSGARSMTIVPPATITPASASPTTVPATAATPSAPAAAAASSGLAATSPSPAPSSTTANAPADPLPATTRPAVASATIPAAPQKSGLGKAPTTKTPGVPLATTSPDETAPDAPTPVIPAPPKSEPRATTPHTNNSDTSWQTPSEKTPTASTSTWKTPTSLQSMFSSPSTGTWPAYATGAPKNNAKGATPATEDPTPVTTTASSSISAGSDMATMMVQAMVLAYQARGNATPASVTPAPPSTLTPPAAVTALAAKVAAPASAPFTSKFSPATTTARAGAFPATPAPASTPATAALPESPATPVVLTSAAATVTPASVPLAHSDAAVQAQASITPVPATKTSANGKEIPLAASSRSSTSNPTKEKKSAAGATEGSFLQSGVPAAKDPSSTSNLTATPVPAVANTSENQAFATPSNPGKSPAGSAITSAVSSVGTAHDQRKASMNSDVNIPDMMTGATASNTSRPAPEVNILLGSNNDFEDAIKQVVHIAQLNDAAASRTPTRVAIELQTPPGAIVNVYVSKQDDSYRAQLSTTDPAALSWVQDKIASLRQSNDLGVEVKWLPAQIESNSLSATTPSSDGSNLNWNRDGQHQHNPTPDDRNQSQRQDPSAYEDLTEAEADNFAGNLEAVGGAA